MDLYTLGWLIFGVALMVAELFVPGLVIIFFGASAVLVGLASWMGLVGSLGAGMALWLGGSAGLVLVTRSTARRLARGEVARGSTDEELDAFGQPVEVVEAVGPDCEGRIRFRGTTWRARTLGERLEPGARARIVTRDNQVWIVEAEDSPFLPEPDLNP